MFGAFIIGDELLVGKRQDKHLPFLILISIWLYTLVFAFSSLWFAHYLLAALQRLRRDDGSGAPDGAGTSDNIAALPLEPARGLAP